MGLCSEEVRREFFNILTRYKILFDPGWLPAVWQRKPTSWAALGARRMSSYWKGEFGQTCWLCLRSYHNISPPDPWKWKWSNAVGKSEMSISISITNTVKSNKKINETAEAGNCTDFPLISCGNGLKSTKTMQTFFSQIGIFLRYPWQGSTFHRASSQAELNQIYFLLKRVKHVQIFLAFATNAVF